MAINKVVYGDQTLVDLTSDTVSSDKLLSGETAHDRSGNQISGSVVVQNYTEGDGIDISANNEISVDTTFTEASTRTNISSGDTLSTIWGKIKKFFSDLKTVAFTGSYTDLTNQPTIIKVTRGSSTSTATANYWAAMCNSTQTGSPTLPTTGKWWHVLSMDWTGTDTKNWLSQLAIATQEGNGVWWRKNDAGGTEIDSSTWHRLAEGDSNGNASYANDSAKLGGASASESATASTIVKRDSSGYIHAVYYNASNGAENINSYSTAQAMFKDANGWQRCTSKANFQTWLGLGNYLPLAGGTMTGLLKAERGSYSWLCSSGGGTAGYFRFLKISVTASYVNTPIVLSILDRGKWETVCSIVFANSGGTDPNCTVIYRGSRPVYYVKVQTSSSINWYFYVQKAEAYANAKISILNAGQLVTGGLDFTWQDATETTLPVGVLEAGVESQNLSVSYATSAGSAVDQTARNTANAALPKAGGTMTGTLYLKPSTGSYTEGIRITPYNSWSTIMLLGADTSATSGTSANSWGFFNNNGNFYITRNGSNSSSNNAGMLACISSQWKTLNDFVIQLGKSLYLSKPDNSASSQLYTSSNGTLFVKANAWMNLCSPQQIQCRNANDSAWINIAAANISSSRRFKENIQDLTEEEAKKILDIRTVTFDFKEQYSPSSDWEHERFNQPGVIAEEVVDIYPTLVRYSNYENPDEEPVPTFVEYSHFVPYLIKMVQMQQKEIDDLKKQINYLFNQNNT